MSHLWWAVGITVGLAAGCSSKSPVASVKQSGDEPQTSAVARKSSEDDAKAVAQAFVDAYKAQNLDTLMAASDAPFFFDGDTSPDAAALRADMADMFKERAGQDMTKLKFTLSTVATFAAFEAATKLRIMEHDRNKAEGVVGKDGLLILLETTDGKREEKGAVGVRIKNGSFKAVALFGSLREDKGPSGASSKGSGPSASPSASSPRSSPKGSGSAKPIGTQPGAMRPRDPIREVAELPEVAAHFAKRGWKIEVSQRLGDFKNSTMVEIRDKEKSYEGHFEPGDAAIIAKAKSLQSIDLRQVKNLTDADVALIAGNQTLEGIVVGGDGLTDAGLKSLANCKNLECVALFAPGKGVTDAGVAELVKLPKLQCFSCRDGKLTGTGLAGIAGSKTLRILDLNYIEGLTDAASLAAAKVPNLDRLVLKPAGRETAMTPAGLAAVLAARMPPKLEVDPKLLDDANLIAMVEKGAFFGPDPVGGYPRKPPTAEAVTSISLRGSKVTAKGIAALNPMANLTLVDLAQTGCDDATLAALAALPKLDKLIVDGTKATGSGFAALAALPLKSVTVYDGKVGASFFQGLAMVPAVEEVSFMLGHAEPAAVKHLAALSKLKKLWLPSNAVDDAAAKALGTLPALEDLGASGSEKLTDAGLAELIKAPKLKVLNVQYSKVTKEGVAKAKAARPDLKITSSVVDR